MIWFRQILGPKSVFLTKFGKKIRSLEASLQRHWQLLYKGIGSFSTEALEAPLQRQWKLLYRKWKHLDLLIENHKFNISFAASLQRARFFSEALEASLQRHWQLLYRGIGSFSTEAMEASLQRQWKLLYMLLIFTASLQRVRFLTEALDALL